MSASKCPIILRVNMSDIECQQLFFHGNQSLMPSVNYHILWINFARFTDPHNLYSPLHYELSTYICWNCVILIANICLIHTYTYIYYTLLRRFVHTAMLVDHDTIKSRNEQCPSGNPFNTPTRSVNPTHTSTHRCR